MTAPAQVSNRHIWAFLSLAFLLSWPIWIASGVLPRAGAGAYDWRWLVAQVGVFGPSLSAIAVSSVISPQSRQGNVRLLAVLLLPLAIPGALIAAAAPDRVVDMPAAAALASLLVAAAVILFFGRTGPRPVGVPASIGASRPGRTNVTLSLLLFPALFLAAWILAAGGGGVFGASALEGGPGGSAWLLLVVFAHNLLLGGSLGEEVGWRGFLLPALLQRMGPLAASLTLAFVWGLWHLPIDLYAGFGAPGAAAVAARIVYLVPLSVLFTWFYLRTGGSLLVALFLHTSLNVMGDLGLSGFDNAAALFFVLAAVAAGFAAVDLANPGRSR